MKGCDVTSPSKTIVVGLAGLESGASLPEQKGATHSVRFFRLSFTGKHRYEPTHPPALSRNGPLGEWGDHE
jgi:hypothetical protein